MAAALATAARDLQRSASPQQSLERLSELGTQLHALDDPGLAAQLEAAGATAGPLSGVATLAPLARALATGDLGAAATALRALAADSGRLDAATRQAVAQALAAAGRLTAAASPDLTTALSAAATALGRGDPSGAAQALQSAAAQLDTLRQRQQDQSMVTTAEAGAAADQSRVASQVDADRQASGQQLSGSAGQAAVVGGQGNGHNPSSQGASVLGPAQGGAAEQGGPLGGGQPAGGSGGQGGGAGGSGASTAPLGGHDQVYVPGPPGLELPDLTQPALLVPGASVPLSDARSVLAEFEQAALEALDRGDVDAADRDLVRQYFSALGGS